MEKYKINKFILIFIILFILIFNLLIRHKNFLLPHFVGDQMSYIGTAMKLEKTALSEYNLKNIGISFNTTKTVAVFYYPSKSNKGDIIKIFENQGVNFYDQPLFHAPPLFSYILMLSHKIFNGKTEFKALLDYSKDTSKMEIISVQFYAVIISILSSILVTFFTFFLGRILFDNITGLIASFLITISPASIFVSYRIWADETLTLFILLTAIFGYLTFNKNNLIFSFLCGTMLAFSLLTKNNALIFIIPLLYMFYFLRQNTLKPNSTKLITIFITVFMLTLPWYLKVTKVFGTPFYNPEQLGISQKVGYFKMINERPWFTFLVNIPFQLPIYILGYLAIINLFIKGTKKGSKDIFLGTWFLSFLIILTYFVIKSEMLGPDIRYMLPAYPALAILSSRMMIKIRNNFHCYFRYIDIIIIMLLILSSFWAIKITLPFALNSRMPILKLPF